MELSVENTVERVKIYPLKKYNCHIIILYGSYLEGDYTPESDIEILCFTDSIGGINDTSMLNGVQLDVWVVNSKQLENPNDYLHIVKNEVLLDRGLKQLTLLMRSIEFIMRVRNCSMKINVSS